MIKRLATSVVVLLLLSQLVAGFALAAEDNNQYYIKAKITKDIKLEPYGLQFSYSYLDAVIDAYMRYGYFSNDIADVNVALRNYTGNGSFDVAIISHSRTGVKYLDIFSLSGNRMTRVFSGSGSNVELGADSFSIGNVKNDGRYYYEAYTYKWRDGKFLRTGYSKTYIKDWNDFYYDYGYDYDYDFVYPGRPIIRPEKPVKKDERISVVRSLVNARMAGKDSIAKGHLTESLKKQLGNKGIDTLVPYGRLTTVDIFDSQRGDWVVAIIKDSWGIDRVFKFVPVKENGSYKINSIVEIPKAN